MTTAMSVTLAAAMLTLMLGINVLKLSGFLFFLLILAAFAAVVVLCDT